jgi:DNA-binding XRE family transcriptional regulator
MQAVVKTPLTEITISGQISQRLFPVLKEEFGEQVRLSEEDGADDETVNLFETAWYKDTRVGMSPGENLKIYRENNSLAQAKLSELLGGIPRQHVLNMERGIRSISLKTARKLSKLFRVSPDKFI